MTLNPNLNPKNCIIMTSQLLLKKLFPTINIVSVLVIRFIIYYLFDLFMPRVFILWLSMISLTRLDKTANNFKTRQDCKQLSDSTRQQTTTKYQHEVFARHKSRPVVHCFYFSSPRFEKYPVHMVILPHFTPLWDFTPPRKPELNSRRFEFQFALFHVNTPIGYTRHRTELTPLRVSKPFEISHVKGPK